MISALSHVARLTRAAYVFAREGVFGVVDPLLVPPPGQLLLRAARLIEEMEAQGVVSAPSHNGNREVLAPPPPKG